MTRIEYKSIIFNTNQNVYEPREDSFLLAENLGAPQGDVLDMGTGSGIQGILAAEQAERVVCADINPHAVELAKENAELNGVSEKMKFAQSDLFENIKGKFDLIIFNPPYLPKEGETEEWIDHSWNSSEVMKKFLAEYRDFLKPGGKCLLVNSSISGVELGGEIVARQKLAFEEIFVVSI
ncbi:MAG: HemK2/MTQ2 family protein methyltransferase [archaeon]